MSRIARFSPSLLAFAAASALSLVTGCSFNPDIDSRGSKGVADFSFESSQCALFGCGLDKPVALGSSMTVNVQLPNKAGRAYTIHVDDASMGTVTNGDESCTASSGNGNDSHSVSCTSPSVSVGQTVTASFNADFQTAAPGTLAFSLLDDTGAVVDTGSFVVHAAASIDTTVYAVNVEGNRTLVTAGADGAYTVKIGSKINVDFVVKDSDGTALVFTQHGVVPTYSDSKTIGSDSDPALSIIGNTDTEYAVAGAKGDAQIRFDAHDASKVVSFHVVQ
jgi:hypothetical protein